MDEKRVLALLGFLLGLVAGVLILVGALELGRNQSITVELIAGRIVQVVFGVVILFASLLIYRRTTNAGGFVNLIVGIIGLFVPGIGTTEAALAIISGILGLIASGAFK